MMMATLVLLTVLIGMIGSVVGGEKNVARGVGLVSALFGSCVSARWSRTRATQRL